MSPRSLLEYLSSLLNRTIAPGERITLSSAQRARLIGWLEVQGMSVESRWFTAPLDVDQLIGRLIGAANPGDAASQTFHPPFNPLPLAVARGGVGIDIQSVSELVKASSINDLKSDTELRAIFTLRELSYAQTKDSPAETLTGLFAAKEAIKKADPAFFGRPLTEVEILPDQDGAPVFAGFAISVSHSAGLAVAIAIRMSMVAAERPASTIKSDQPWSHSQQVAVVSPRRYRPVGIGVVTALACAAAVAIVWLTGLVR